MATAAEAAQDMTRVLQAVNKFRRFLKALDDADALRHSASANASALQVELDHAEKAGDRVYAYLTDADPIAITTWRDGGPMGI